MLRIGKDKYVFSSNPSRLWSAKDDSVSKFAKDFSNYPKDTNGILII